MKYRKPEEIEIKLAHDISGFDAASRAAIVDNAQCLAFITLWMAEKGYTNIMSFTVRQSEINNAWRSIQVCCEGTPFFAMQECASGTWVVCLGDPTRSEQFANIAGRLGCDF